MKTYGVEGQLLGCFTLALDIGEWSASLLQPLALGENLTLPFE
jgi:hypothetical protein